jgi:hypothetical protein
MSKQPPRGTKIVLRPFLKRGPSEAYSECITYQYPNGWVTPAKSGRTWFWYASKTKPQMDADNLWTIPTTLGTKHSTKTAAVAALD